MSRSKHTSYDDLPYDGQAIPVTHPDHLATVATLMGLSPIHPDQCRVLELGCGDGRNLIPMAATLPGASLTGIDLSATHIKLASHTSQELGLSNIFFSRMDLSELPADFGEFDYIVCHGVFSWVPHRVRCRILEICNRHLSSDGVAFISFNIFPGWHIRRMVRDMAKLHIDRSTAPLTQLNHAREFLQSFLAGIAEQSDSYSQLVKSEVGKALRHPDYYFFHEFLEEENQPFYLHEVAAQAANCGLRYFADAELPLSLPVSGAPAIETFLNATTIDRISRDQHLDFITNRTFRKSLFCRWDRKVSTDPIAANMRKLHVSSGGRCVSPSVSGSDYTPMEFSTFYGDNCTVTEPLVKAAFVHITKISPKSITIDELLAVTRNACGDAGRQNANSSDLDLLTHWLLRTHRNTPASLVHLRCVPLRHQTELPDLPYVDRVARLFASRGGAVVNRRHECLSDDITYQLMLPLLDGTRDQTMIAEELEQMQKTGQVSIAEEETSSDATDRLLNTFLQFGLYAMPLE